MGRMIFPTATVLILVDGNDESAMVWSLQSDFKAVSNNGAPLSLDVLMGIVLWVQGNRSTARRTNRRTV